MDRGEVMKKSDAEILKLVVQSLRWDTRVKEGAIAVQVDDGTVTLTGTVGSWGERVAAQEAAHRVSSVLDLANQIRVEIEGEPPLDAAVAGWVQAVLQLDVFVPYDRIRAAVSNGWVTIEGDVDYWSQREAVDRALRNLRGVRGIVNRVLVRRRDPRTDDVRQAVEAALKRQAEREAEDVRLFVLGGRVVVTGAVHSSKDREAVLGAIRGTPGVWAVEDRLCLEPRAA